ncbi:MAG: HlyD family secretion protein [Hyphomicrobiaceae bacterium]
MSNRKRQSDERSAADQAAQERTASAAAVPTEVPEIQSPTRKRRFFRIAALTLLGPLLAVAIGLYLYLTGGRYVTTDNAYIKSDKVAVSTDISGRVSEVLVRSNQVVKPGDVLFRIDAEPFQLAVDEAKAKLLAAKQDGEVQKYLYREKLASLEKARVDVSFYERRFARQSRLRLKSIASQSTLDTAEQEMQNAKAQINVLRQELSQAVARLGGDADTPVARLSGVLAAAAVLKQAELDLKRTEVRASLDGVIANFDLQKGEYVEEGKVVFSIVGTRDVWVQANFRETDLTHIREGQSAKIRVDAYPEHGRDAIVTSIDPATGAEFALLPPQNATGNWVKVVQRLPVRLKLKDPQQSPQLRTGMSVVVEVDTQHRRSLEALKETLVGWFRG